MVYCALRVVGLDWWWLVGVVVVLVFGVVGINSVVVAAYIWLYVFVWVFGLVNCIDLSVVFWLLRCLFSVVVV